jgi:hypothetical protein
MLRALFFLHSFLADYETLAEIARGTFDAGLASLFVFCCASVRFVVREWPAIRRLR